jgi:hypothetical protein
MSSTVWSSRADSGTRAAAGFEPIHRRSSVQVIAFVGGLTHLPIRYSLAHKSPKFTSTMPSKPSPRLPFSWWDRS